MRSIQGILAIVAVGTFLRPTFAAEKLDAKKVEFFETKIRPVLVKHCYECHSAKSSKLKGNLLLDTRLGIAEGGDSGPALIPGKPADSLLIQSLRHDGIKMPPKEQLPESVIRDFEKWVEMGAPDPREGTAAKAYKTLTLEESKDFWSFKPPVHHPVPVVKDKSWARGDVDRFILAQLEKKGLKPAGDAEPLTLLRRLHLDLIGLPPTLDEIEAFLKDPSVEKLVDRLLASPHYGERWGRYWLDIARYAETNGNADNIPFPNAFHYRDYVIRAYNLDKPYDHFVREQIAGDLLPAKSDKDRDEHLTATGLLALTSKPRAQNNPDYKYDLIADQIDVTTRSVLGLSVMCARCHDHKFDPISTKEYYSMAGIFDSSTMMFGDNAGKGNANKGVRAPGYTTLSDGSKVMGISESTPKDINVCVRGESKDLGELAPRGFLKAVPVKDAPEINRKQSGRLELAQYLSSPNNPFTARVAVNRIWQHLFGQGIVRSPDNFGNLGEAPTHPELLDHLALHFIKEGWSTKKMIKHIVLSRTYRQSSDFNAANYKIDADNFNLWRMPVRRLDAESIRDSILVVSGQLDREPMKGTLLGNFQPKGRKDNMKETNNRSVYLAMVRGAPITEVLSLFDIANPNLVVAQREVTTVPAQALFLMNSRFIQEQSKAFAGRLLEKKDITEEARIDLAYKTAFARQATADERQKALAFLTSFAQQSGAEGRGTAWTALCQTLYASAEFRYVE